jgi:hypothetical protein
LRRIGPATLLAVLVVCLGIGVSSGACRAAEPLGPARPNGLPEVLASVTILSEAAMAQESAAGVQAAPMVGNQSGQAKVLLWDELKSPPQLPTEPSGTVTLSTVSPGK